MLDAARTRRRARLASAPRRRRARDPVRQRCSRLRAVFARPRCDPARTGRAGGLGQGSKAAARAAWASPASTHCGDGWPFAATWSPSTRARVVFANERGQPAHAARRAPDPRPPFAEPTHPHALAPHVRHASARRRRRPPLRPGAARPLRRVDHPALHSRQPRAAQVRLSHRHILAHEHRPRRPRPGDALDAVAEPQEHRLPRPPDRPLLAAREVRRRSCRRRPADAASTLAIWSAPGCSG